ncbi:histidine phosphatase family protein [Microvirga flavescens]|uniref:histidine phosphatase family protein n=1 Tax=Microvirga flavescens TaxID=2249811 RepID=UPI000DD66027|nr:histidine phosphatase family protein [Microvirga flavescens]
MIYLIRHGETLWNAAGRYQGRMDSPLTERGREQADSLGRLLAQETRALPKPLKAHVSPLGRTQATADLIARHVTLAQSNEPRLAEISLGSWDGMTRYEVGIEYPDALNGADAFDWFFRSPDGETFETLCERVASWLADIDGPVVAISHGVTGRVIRGLYLGLSKHEMLHLPAPQEGFFKLHQGRVELIGAASGAEA